VTCRCPKSAPHTSNGPDKSGPRLAKNDDRGCDKFASSSSTASSGATAFAENAGFETIGTRAARVSAHVAPRAGILAEPDLHGLVELVVLPRVRPTH
jgi:hypothetical protein